MKCPYCGVDDGPVERPCRCPRREGDEEQYLTVRLCDVEARREEGWELAGYDPRYLPAFGSLWMKR